MYNYFIIQKLINLLIFNGKKSIILNEFLKVLKHFKISDEIAEKNIPLEIFLKNSLQNVKPLLYIYKYKLKNKVLIIPKIINSELELKIALK